MGSILNMSWWAWREQVWAVSRSSDSACRLRVQISPGGKYAPVLFLPRGNAHLSDFSWGKLHAAWSCPTGNHISEILGFFPRRNPIICADLSRQKSAPVVCQLPSIFIFGNHSRLPPTSFNFSQLFLSTFVIFCLGAQPSPSSPAQPSLAQRPHSSPAQPSPAQPHPPMIAFPPLPSPPPPSPPRPQPPRHMTFLFHDFRVG